MPITNEDLYEQEQERKPEEPSKKKKKGFRKKTLFLLFLLLLLGLLGGLHLTGSWDARPLLYGTIPSLPLVGPKLAAWLDIPEEYSLTVEERRELDLQKRQEILQEWERKLREEGNLLEILSRDLGTREQQILREEQRLAASSSDKTKEPSEELSEKNIKNLLQVYGEMSARNAAEIMQNLSAELAVTLLSRMPQDQAAKILAKMDPPRAAYLTKQLANRTNPQQ